MIKKSNKKLFVFAAVIGLLIFFHFIKILRPIENIIITTLNPVISGMYSVGSDLETVYVDHNDKKDLAKIVLELEKENKSLNVENAKLKNVEDENRKLRQHLKFLEENKYNYILSNIISRDMFNEDRSVLIDKGYKDGIREGYAVVDSYGIVVGKIIEAKENISKIYLITNSKCKFASSVQNRDKTIGIAEGDLGLIVKMNLIPQKEIINIGDNVVTFGFNGKVPKGLLIGRVKEVEKGSNEVWQEAIIESSADLDSLTIVSVLLP